MTINKLEFHPVSNIFPLMQGEEFESLISDIKENGLLEPITLYSDGKIIDGRNRYLACEKAGIAPKYSQWNGNGSPLAFVISLNLKRRHLDSTQKAIAAEKALPMYEAEAKERQQEHGNTAPGKAKTLSEKIPYPEEAGKATEQAAKDFNVNSHYISDIKRIRIEKPELYQDMIDGNIKIAKAKKTNLALLHTGDQESYTPAIYIEAAREVMGSIDTDPASNEIAQKTVKAKTYYTPEDDGLTKEWNGNIFLNPPYSHPEIKYFIDKLLDELKPDKKAILLTNNNTDTNWFYDAAKRAAAICFTKGRINFYKANGDITSPTNGQTFFYFGSNEEKFIALFSKFGLVMKVI